ncbi:hypothetical protein FNF27_07167 [Cafeteria roenbergensis]|uniref:Uncharacterized protein n=1 Tax=Cafeteria roenbergensis TaxID=33653 RepID=A0A5A8DUI9_CAFRO|nr:hypothetical protein FNF27_07167 [Cafeteria roenbergensis]
MTNDHAMRGGTGRHQAALSGALLDWHSANASRSRVEVIWLPPVLRPGDAVAASNAMRWMRRMPWPCAPLGSDRSRVVAALLGVDEAFSLCLVHPSGAVLSRRAWDRIRTDPTAASFPWTLPPVPRLVIASVAHLQLPGGARIRPAEHLAGAHFVLLYCTLCSGVRKACFEGRRAVSRLLGLLRSRQRRAIDDADPSGLASAHHIALMESAASDAARLSAGASLATRASLHASWGSRSAPAADGEADAPALGSGPDPGGPGGYGGGRGYGGSGPPPGAVAGAGSMLSRSSEPLSGLGSHAMTPRAGASVAVARASRGDLSDAEGSWSAELSADDSDLQGAIEGGDAGARGHGAWQNGRGVTGDDRYGSAGDGHDDDGHDDDGRDDYGHDDYGHDDIGHDDYGRDDDKARGRPRGAGSEGPGSRRGVAVALPALPQQAPTGAARPPTGVSAPGRQWSPQGRMQADAAERVGRAVSWLAEPRSGRRHEAGGCGTAGGSVGDEGGAGAVAETAPPSPGGSLALDGGPSYAPSDLGSHAPSALGEASRLLGGDAWGRGGHPAIHRPSVSLRVVVVPVDAHAGAASVSARAFDDFVDSLPRGFACVPLAAPQLLRALYESVRVDPRRMLRGGAAGGGARPELAMVDSSGRLLLPPPAMGDCMLDAVATDPDGFPWRGMRSRGVTPLLDSVQLLFACADA